MRVVFGDQVCRDCGQRGDERLLSDLCHERKVEKERKLLNFNCGKKKVCSNCGEAWSRYVAQIQKMELELIFHRKLLGMWSFTSGAPCVRVRNPRDAKPGERLAEGKGGHTMQKVNRVRDVFHCMRGLH